MLLPDKPAAKTDEPVTFTYQFGHPFEHQLFDTMKPTELYVIAPDGAKTDLTATLEKTTADGTDGKKVAGYKFTFTPAKRGDYTLVAVSPEVKVDGEPHPLRDVIKTVLHVQTQNGWDRRVVTGKASAVELSPLTRPYGLTGGMAFQVEAEEPADGDRKPLGRIAIEVEKYNPVPPKDLPDDEFITRTARTTRSGDATVTLGERGWWAVTAVRDRDQVRHRCTLWIHVDDKPHSK
ncbi:Additional periplasmic component NikK of nickel ECF transporter [Fimbriiglobus ruber]|uniref:Additional periplasmic component NikK of nickel ECF transporter n=2 Tax=Fimbriiglobus ruber TaxID=1908690 RepID=A0A225DP03_9BACT|nr:Additional periplasmic component NikK of nickel ECF transporter [Fimbriiglobus ruber]